LSAWELRTVAPTFDRQETNVGADRYPHPPLPGLL